jgi:hypothetical protein
VAGAPRGPREPWRTLGTPFVVFAVALLGAAALIGIALVEGLGFIGERWLRAVRLPLATLMGALAALIAAQAIGQKMALPFTWTEEVATILAALAVWIALPGLVAERELLSIEGGPVSRRAWARGIALAATLLFFLLAFVLCWRAMPAWGLTTPTLHLPRRLIWLLFPLAIILTAGAAVHRAASGGKHER